MKKFNLRNIRFMARQWMTKMNWNYGRGDIYEFKFGNDGFGHVTRIIKTGGPIGFAEKRKFRLSIGVGVKDPIVKLHFLGHTVVLFSKGKFREV